jgi:hypothetical protein
LQRILMSQPVARVVPLGPGWDGRAAIASPAGRLANAGGRACRCDLEAGVAAQCFLDGLVGAAEHDRVHSGGTHLQSRRSAAMISPDIHIPRVRARPALAGLRTVATFLAGHQLGQRKLPAGS